VLQFVDNNNDRKDAESDVKDWQRRCLRNYGGDVGCLHKQCSLCLPEQEGPLQTRRNDSSADE
jgi:hypothetical protein